MRRAKITALLCGALVLGSSALACDSILGNADGQFVQPDANVDARTDASVFSADGGVDATPAVDAGGTDATTDSATGFCALISPTPAFCADFDEPDAGSSFGFASAVSGSGCTIALDTTNASPPMSLRAVTTSTSGCYVSTQVTPTQSIAIDLDVRMDTLPPISDQYDGVFQLRAGTSGPDYVFYANEDGAYFQASGKNGQSQSDSLPPPVLGTFRHVHMMLVLTTGASPMISGSYAGTTITFSGATQGTTEGPFDPGTSTEVRVGLPELYISAAGDVFIDNVVVNVH